MNARVKGMLEYGASRVARTRPGRAAATAAAALGAYLSYKAWDRLAGEGAPAGPRGAARRRLNGNGAVGQTGWGGDMQKLDDIARKGQEIYHRLQKKLEAESANQCIFINTATGDYVLGGTFGETHMRFVERFGDAPSWDARIGEAPRVINRARPL